MANALRENTYDSGTITLNYAEGPVHGPPFILIHGGSSSWRYGTYLLERLSTRWHVFAPDLRGHGESGKMPGYYTLFDYASDIAMFLRGVVQKRAIVFGHSLGGQIALTLAANHPEFVQAVITGDAVFSPVTEIEDGRQNRQMVALWQSLAGQPVESINIALRDMRIFDPGQQITRRAEDVLGPNNPWFEFQAMNLHQVDPDTLTVVLKGSDELLAGEAPDQILRAITCPVLLVQADPALGSSMDDLSREQALALLPHGTYVKLSGIGHELYGSPNRAMHVEVAIEPFLRRFMEVS